MARKNLLKGLMDNAAKAADAPRPEAASDAPPGSPKPVSKVRPRYTKGAIGAVGQSIADLKSRAIAELDPFAIDQGGVVDRLDDDAADHSALMDSIRDHGQQVPVLVRPHPEAEDRYQIVYGRRRVKALRDLGLPVKAMIRDLDDRELVIAQGQENTARKDLTFIEKANFARQMRDGGYDRKIICDALHVDKTQISRMLSVVDAVPLDLVEAIGSAPSVGRNRWMALSELLTATETDTVTALGLIAVSGAERSDARFEALMHALTLPRRRQAEDEASDVSDTILRSDVGVEVGRLVRRSGRMVMTVPLANAEGFDDWLARNFHRIHSDWLASRAEAPDATGEDR
jgi:ParB family chromosome partitioning protein